MVDTPTSAPHTGAYLAQSLDEVDPEVSRVIRKETEKQSRKLVLIASENYSSEAVLEACGSVMSNKYAEGYAGKRYYGGCEFVDMTETLAIERACRLFDAEHANVQPHCGTQANMGVYYAALQPGDTLMGMGLSEGGHLSHGHRLSFSGQLYNVVTYGVDPETEVLDYDAMATIAREHRPKLIVVGFSAYPRHIDFGRCREIADEVGAVLHADIAHPAGLVAAGLHPNPCPHADFVSSTTHKTLRGPRGGLVLCREEHASALDRAVFPGIQGGPFEHQIAAKAVCFGEALEEGFKAYAAQIIANAKALATALDDAGFRCVSGGTDTHLVLIDVGEQGITGKEAEVWLDETGIVVNKNTIPYDQRSPFVTSGVRIGTAAVTSRGLTEGHMRQVIDWMARVLESRGDPDIVVEVAAQVRELTDAYPIYDWRLR
ncbi:MAG TPA: serine hydroxymethyltransferase [Acidobacteriota bacterium]|nr:serine hydroxymethyltransferase [Acidobacteriota bacterium]